MRSIVLRVVMFAVGLSAAVWLASCASSRTSSALDKKTDWLGNCQKTLDCREGLQCVGGLCTTPCSERSGCARYGEDAICASVASASECPASLGVRTELACTLACQRRSECAEYNNDLLCIASACATDPCEVDARDDGGLDGSADDGGSVTDEGVTSSPAGDGGDSMIGMPPEDASTPNDDASGDASSGPLLPDAAPPDAALPDAALPDAGRTACIEPDVPGPLSDEGFAPSPVMLEASLTRVAVNALDLAGDVSRGRLYALASATDSSYPSQLVVIDSADGAVIDALDVGTDPSVLAITDDEATLWVGSRSTHAIHELSLAGELPVLVDSYALPAEWTSSQLIVVPPASSAGARPPLIDFSSLPEQGVFIGQVTLAPGMAIASPNSGSVPPQVAAGPPGWFFGYNDYSSGFDFYTIDATSMGLEQRTRGGILISGYQREIVYDRDGVLYVSSGEVIDVRDPTAPRRAGSFAYGGHFLPIAGSDLVLMVGTSYRTSDVVQLLDTATFSRVSWLRAPFGVDSVGAAVALSRDRAAFIGNTPSGSAVYMTPPIPTEIPNAKIAPVIGPSSIEVPVAARALVMDQLRGVLYAAVGAGAPAYENRVITIEPDTGEIVDSIPVGARPVALALTDDASTLWVSVGGSWEVRRITLPCTSGAPIVGPAYELPYHVESPRLFPIAGRPTSIAAQVSHNTAFFDDGVMRPGFNEEISGSASMVGGPPGVLFAYDDETSGYTFYSILYDDSGVTQVAQGRVISGYNKGLAYDPDGFVYATTGEVIDVRNPLSPSYVGTFDVPIGTFGNVLPLAGPIAIWVSRASFSRLDATTMSITGGAATGCADASNVNDIVHVSPGRIAFASHNPTDTTRGTVCIITNPALIP